MRPTRTSYLLRMATLSIRVELDRRLRAFGLTAIQYTILSILAHRENFSSADLARRFLVTPQTMNEMIKSLERNGLVVRTADTANRRILRTALTRKGVSVLAKCDERVDQMESELLQIIGIGQLDRLRESLRMIGAKFPRNGTKESD